MIKEKNHITSIVTSHYLLIFEWLYNQQLPDTWWNKILLVNPFFDQFPGFIFFSFTMCVKKAQIYIIYIKMILANKSVSLQKESSCLCVYKSKVWNYAFFLYVNYEPIKWKAKRKKGPFNFFHRSFFLWKGKNQGTNPFPKVTGK